MDVLAIPVKYKTNGESWRWRCVTYTCPRLSGSSAVWRGFASGELLLGKILRRLKRFCKWWNVAGKDPPPSEEVLQVMNCCWERSSAVWRGFASDELLQGKILRRLKRYWKWWPVAGKGNCLLFWHVILSCVGKFEHQSDGYTIV
jgi:hypothetical protein